MTEFNNRRILIIDDDTRIHEDFRKILGDSEDVSEYDEMESMLFSDDKTASTTVSYELESAYQGQEGFEKVQQAKNEGNPYAMAFVDMRMPPGWDGLETIKHIWDVDKNIQLVICTAYSDYSWSEVLYHLGASDRLIILKKPFDMVEVQQIATALTTKWNLSCESVARLKKIQESEEKYRTVVDSVDDTIMTLDMDGNIIFVNHNPWNMISQAAGNNYYMGIKEEYRNSLKDSVRQVIETGGQKNVEYASVDENENTIWSEGRISPYYKNDEVVAATLVASDISARKALDWQLRHDELTGLGNRAYFSTKVENCIKNKTREESLAILFIDLDHFNLINDCFGHELGDKLLIEISRVLNEYVYKGEMLARLGGDEFAILKCLHNADEIKQYAEELCERLKQSITIDGFDIYPSVSIGIVLSKDENDTVKSLMRDADAALHHAKSSGRNRYEYFDYAVREKIVKRVELGGELRAAIREDQFEVLYQPLASVSEKKITGFEALLRWNHPGRGVISPVDFIPIAEETGLIVPITRMVLHKVSHQIKLWQEAGLAGFNVAVNCSAREFNEQKLEQIVQQVIDETGGDIHRLELELTESSIMDDVQKAIENMRKLSDIGLSISIDDFGTGYSSFSYIKQFTIDKLKIDRVFVKDIPADEDDAAIVEAIIAMAKRLKIKVVAEGVETVEQVNFLLRAQCDYIQGFILGMPLPVDEVTRRLENNDWPLHYLSIEE